MTWDKYISQCDTYINQCTSNTSNSSDTHQLLSKWLKTNVSDVCCESRDQLDALRYAQNRIAEPMQEQISKDLTSKVNNAYPTKVSDILKMYGDLPIVSLTSEMSYDEIPRLTAEFHLLPNAFVTSYDEKAGEFVMNYIYDKEKENKKMAFNNNTNNSMFDAFNGMFGKVDNGMCRLSMNGSIAVKTSNGYKTWNTKSGRLVNCANFVFPAGDELFFIIPTNKVAVGDIIMVSGLPRYVLKKDKGTITVINYEDSTVDTILPERHIFMGEAYFYGKIVSIFGDDITGGGKKGMGKIMKYMMLSEMMKGGMVNGQNNAMASMLPYMLMSGGNMGDFFSGIFDFGDDEDISDADAEDSEDPIANLTASLKEGKITGEEFIKKVQELGNEKSDNCPDSKD